MNNFLKKILLIFSSTGLLIILFYSFMLWPWGDDMLYIHNLSKTSLLNFTINEGRTIDARWLTPLAFIRNFIYKYIPHSFAIFFYIILFFASTYIILSFFDLKLKDKNEKFIFWAFFTIILFYGLNKVTSEIIFWQAGAYYTLNLFFGLLWIKYFNKTQKKELKQKDLLIFYLLSFLAGTFTYNLTIALLTYAFLMLIINKFYNFRKVVWAIALILLLILSLIFMPGAFNRTQIEHFTFYKQILNIFRAFIHVPKNYFSLSYTVIILTTLFSFTYFLYNPQKKYNDIKLENYKSFFKYFFYLIVGFSTIAPFLIASHLASLRTAVYFLIFETLFVFSFSSDIFYRIFSLEKPQKNLAGIIILIFMIFHIFIFADHYYIAYDIRKQYFERHNFLLKARQKNMKYVEVKPYEFQFVPFSLYCLKNGELTNDPENYRNQQYQACFDIDTIILKTK